MVIKSAPAFGKGSSMQSSDELASIIKTSSMLSMLKDKMTPVFMYNTFLNILLVTEKLE